MKYEGTRIGLEREENWTVSIPQGDTMRRTGTPGDVYQNGASHQNGDAFVGQFFGAIGVAVVCLPESGNGCIDDSGRLGRFGCGHD